MCKNGTKSICVMLLEEKQLKEYIFMGNNDWFYSNMFDLRITLIEGQAFEDFFCDIQKSNNDSFQKVKASGSTGDRNCDGFNRDTNEFYLCYSPENLKKAIDNGNSIVKINKDINGIIKKWPSIKTLYYVINDKFKGLSPKIYDLISNLKKEHTTIFIELYSMEKLRTVCLSLNEIDKQRILGYCPDLTEFRTCISFETISKIIEYIEKNNEQNIYEDNLVVPDFAEKIKFNRLSEKFCDLLNSARYYIYQIDEFYNVNPGYNKEDLRNYLKGIYNEAVTNFDSEDNNYSDKVFIYMLNEITYNPNSTAVKNNAIIILASFFESCDIFKEPKEVNNEQINA